MANNISQWFVSDAANNTGAAPDFPVEGQAPSTVNDTMRTIYGALARWYNDSDGSLVTAGTSNAYTLTTNNSHAALADQPIIVFRLDRANTGAATLNVDGLGAKALQFNNSDFASGELVADQIIAAVYNATNDQYDVIGGLFSASGEGLAVLANSNTFTNVGTRSNAPIIVENTSPNIALKETSATADEGNWDILADADQLEFRTFTDAGGAGATYVTVLRTGTTVDEIQLDATTLDVNAAADFSSTVDIGGRLTLSNASPILAWEETDAGVDEKLWFLGASGTDQLIWQTRTDAGAAGGTFLTVFRTGTTVDEIQLDATLVDINATGGSGLRVSGATYLGDANATANPLRLVASDSIGDVWMSFLENDASTRKGLIGYQGASDNNLVIENEESATLELWTNAGSLIFSGDSGTTHHLEIASDGGITTQNDAADEVGYKGTPLETQNGNHTLVLTDAGKTIYKASGGAGETITIPANASVAFPVGTQLDIINNGGGTLSIAITTDTLSWAVGGSTGTRTLADHGWAVIKKVATTEWFISGTGVT